MEPRLYRTIHAELSRRIADGTLAPETRLNIGSLADEFDVARETVQKAIRLLAADGLVARYAGLGWFVIPEAERGEAPGAQQQPGTSDGTGA